MKMNGKRSGASALRAGAKEYFTTLECEVLKKPQAVQQVVHLVAEESPALLSQFLCGLRQRIQCQLEQAGNPNIQNSLTRLQQEAFELDTERGD